jgi:hypothetical protein
MGHLPSATEGKTSKGMGAEKHGQAGWKHVQPSDNEWAKKQIDVGRASVTRLQSRRGVNKEGRMEEERQEWVEHETSLLLWRDR